MQNFVPLIARMLMSLIFVGAAFDKIAHPKATQAYMVAHGMPGAPLTAVFMVGAIVFELLGVLSLLLGYQTRWMPVALCFYMLIATAIFHSNFADMSQAEIFSKDLAIAGGLLLLAYFGPGYISLDSLTGR